MTNLADKYGYLCAGNTDIAHLHILVLKISKLFKKHITGSPIKDDQKTNSMQENLI